MTVTGPRVLVLALALTACAASPKGEDMMSGRTIEEVLRAHTGELMSLPGVVGTAQGVCADLPCIKVYVIKKNADLEQRIPGTVEGYPVSVEETGTIRTLPARE
ncbi:MAG TPA: hypothetical protein VK187_03735 [Geobacteraceae bacterium]|nr:hypothetical protein [Geobacteraceae bacterium]